MNYQHIYHAGNHADVFKHLVLMSLIKQYKQKDKPFCIIDTHAGAGKYNLLESPNKEYESGIGLLQQKSQQITQPLIKEYLSLQKNLADFKGSPVITKSVLRSQDELILVEKAPLPYQSLRKCFALKPNVHVHHLSAEIALKSLLPPSIKRSMIFLDPTYEETDEYGKWIDLINHAFKKFSTACYALWFPIKSKNNFFYDKIKKLNVDSAEKIILEFCPLPSDVGTRLNGSGMLLVNAPFTFEKNITPVLNELINLLKQNSHGFQQMIKV